MKPTIVVYTHTDVKDVWIPFFGQTKEYLDDYDKVIFVNKDSDLIPEDYRKVFYDDTKIYRQRLVDCLRKIDDEYIIFHHEDMFLYDQPDYKRLEDYTKYLDNTSDKYFIKLIRGGSQVGFDDRNIKSLKNIDATFEYIFAIQPTIWKRSKLLELVENSKGDNIWKFEVEAQQVCRDRNIYGWYVDDGGKQRGRYHWDSKVYPYIATAVVKGKWCKEYMKEDKTGELDLILDKYGINPNKRGIQ